MTKDSVISIIEADHRVREATVDLTAYPDDGVRARALETGVISCLTVPFNEDDLPACIRTALDCGRAEENGS